MSNKLDLDLSSIIATEREANKSSRGSSRGGRGGRGAHRGSSSSRGGRENRRFNPLDRRSSNQNDRRQSGPRDTQSSTQQSQDQNRVRGDTIFVSGLDKDVNQDDVYDIFSRVGSVRSATVNYDQHGQSLGTAEVTFAGGKDAETAVREYDGAEVDGKVMNVKLIGSFVKTKEIVKRQSTTAPSRDNNKRQRTVTNTGTRGGRQSRGGSARGGRGSSRGGRGGSRGGRGKPASAEDLDAELDKYQSSRGTAGAGQPKSEE